MSFLRVQLMFAILLAFTVAVLYTQTTIIGSWIYPIKYKETIAANAANFELDPYLIAAIIRVESNYDAKKISHRQAIGLMQIMPETSDYIVDRKQLHDVSREQLQIPAHNIYVGSAYVKVLQETFVEKLQTLDGKSQIALLAAAYNAGPGSTAEWVLDGTWDGTYTTLQNIPFGETRHYVQRVIYYYKKYKELESFHT
jgi:soluble lytic murein transglycosylase